VHFRHHGAQGRFTLRRIVSPQFDPDCRAHDGFLTAQPFTRWRGPTPQWGGRNEALAKGGKADLHGQSECDTACLWARCDAVELLLTIP
jgi:hypothetical protein